MPRTVCGGSELKLLLCDCVHGVCVTAVLVVVVAHELLLRRTKLLELVVEGVCVSLLVMFAMSGIRMSTCVVVAAHDI